MKEKSWNKLKNKYSIIENGYTSFIQFDNKKNADDFCKKLNKIYKNKYSVVKVKIFELDIIKKFKKISEMKVKSNRVLKLNKIQIINIFGIDFDI